MGALSVAIVGLGQATRTLHLPAIQSAPHQWSLVAGCDPDPRARESLPAPTYPDLENLLRDESPDALVIATPPALHAEQAVRALEAGCHVLCEKPAAESLEQFDRMVAAAAANGRQLVVNSQFPALKIHRAAEDLIDSPTFGKLVFAELSQLFRVTEETEAGWRGSLSRRVCFEFGPHVFDVLLTLFKQMPERIYCHMCHMPAAGGNESVVLMSLEFDGLESGGGRAASVVLNRLSSGPHRYFDLRLTGEHGIIESSIGGEARIELGLRSPRRPFAALHFARGGKALLQQGDRTRVLAREGREPFAEAAARRYREWARAIQTGQDVPRGLAHQRRVLQLVFAAYESALRREPVSLGETCS